MNLDDVLQQYMETLCTAQKKTNFTHTLIQDISILSGSNSMQLEDWLVDIETTVYLTDESRTKLAWVQSKGLTHTLIMEALTLGKNWEEIKDFTLFKNLQLRYSYFSKLFHGYSTKGQRVFSSLHTQIQMGS